MTENIATLSFEKCLLPLLKALNWHGTHRQLEEARPYRSKLNSIGEFSEVMGHLNYEVKSMRATLSDLDVRLLPCLFVSDTGLVLLLLEETADQTGIRVYDGLLDQESYLTREKLASMMLNGSLYRFKMVKADELKEKHQNWLVISYQKNKGLIHSALGLSFILNLLALAIPLFTMAVYDRVVNTQSFTMLGEFTLGVTFVLVGVYIIYKLRSEHLALIGIRFDHVIADMIFTRLMYLSPTYTETATVGSQVARLKDFDRLRELFSGPLFTVFFELPFVLITLVVIAILGGLMVLIPVIILLLFALVGLMLWSKLRKAVSDSSVLSSTQQDFLLESINKLRALKYLAIGKTWAKRYRTISSDATLTNLQVIMLNAFNLAFSDMMLIVAGLAVLAFGAIKVMDATMTVGAMIAIMILIWRALSPIKAIFNTLPRLQQMGGSIRQISRLFKLQPEAEPGSAVTQQKYHFKGDIQVNRISMRYPGSDTPTLMGVDFHIPAGNLTALIGRNGSGKTTLLKIILGLYPVQAGSIHIDNQDTRQFNPVELRKSIGYLPQVPELFNGTIADNIRLADPTASDEDLNEVAEKAGVLSAILALPEKFNTPIRGHNMMHLASSFEQGICLARAYLKKSSILLLDEPGNTLDRASDELLMKQLQSMRGKTTVVMVTHRPSHLKIMDLIILIDRGQLIMQGPPSEVLPKIPKDFL